MSGDAGLHITLPAALQSLQQNPQVILHLVGDQASLTDAVSDWPDSKRSRIRILHAPNVISPLEKTPALLSASQDTSMRVALDALRQGTVQAVVSAGSSAALMILSRKLLGTVQGATRPAFCSLFPTRKNSVLLLDLGANVDCTPGQLLSFAMLGSIAFSALKSSPSPKIALLSNGTEPEKGNIQIREAAKLFNSHSEINYVGYVEANKLHCTDADIVVCDGMIGNVALKAIEGTARRSVEQLEAVLGSAPGVRFTVDDRQALLASFSSAMNPEAHNGAFLLGLDALVIKAHGASSALGFAAAINQALQCEEKRMIQRMKQQLISAVVE